VLWKENKIAVFVKPPTPSFPLNPKKQSWSKWEWHDVLADWSWKGYEEQPLEVSVYSSCEQVELLLNGKSLGKKKTDRASQFIVKWNVPYKAGELKAVGYKGSRIMASSILQTAEEPATIKLTIDKTSIKADGQGLSYVTVELVDAKGHRNPKAENLLKFDIEGAGTIVGVGNANPVSIESYQTPQRKAWQGRCMVIVKSKKDAGRITLTASAEGIPSSKIVITVASL
jgi:beta-galactosidase